MSWRLRERESEGYARTRVSESFRKEKEIKDGGKREENGEKERTKPQLPPDNRLCQRANEQSNAVDVAPLEGLGATLRTVLEKRDEALEEECGEVVQDSVED